MEYDRVVLNKFYVDTGEDLNNPSFTDLSWVPSELLPIAEAFRANLRAAQLTASVPFELVNAGVQKRRFMQISIAERIRQKFIPEEATDEHQKFREFAESDEGGTQIADEIFGEINALLSDQEMGPAVAELMRQCPVLVWSAFEVLANDLFSIVINLHPEISVKLINDERTKKRFQLKALSVDELAKYGFDLTNKMGDMLRSLHPLDSIDIMRDAFDVIDPGNKELSKHLFSTDLWRLYQRRNLIVHRRGIVDQSYIDRTGDGVGKGSLLNISRTDLSTYLVLTRDTGLEILKSCARLLTCR